MNTPKPAKILNIPSKISNLSSEDEVELEEIQNNLPNLCLKVQNSEREIATNFQDYSMVENKTRDKNAKLSEKTIDLNVQEECPAKGMIY